MHSFYRKRHLAVLLTVLALFVVAISCKDSSRRRKKKGGTNPGTPAVTLVSPNTGSLGGGETVTVITNNFLDDYTQFTPNILFGANAGTGVSALSSNTVTVITPAGAGVGTVDVTVNSTGTPQTATMVGAYTYTNNATVTLVNPNTCDIAGGCSVVVQTSNFIDDFMVSTPTVTFGGAPATNVNATNPSIVTCNVPAAAAAGFVDVTVTSTGESATLLNGFQYTFTPPAFCTVSGVNPPTGSTLGGNTVFVLGANFGTAADPVPTVDFGASPATNVVRNSANQLTVTAPAGAVGPVTVTVTTSTGPCSLNGGYTYVAPPTCNVTSVQPVSGLDTGGNIVSVFGTGFTPSATLTVGGSPTAFTYVSATELRINNMPAGTGTVDIAVDIGTDLCTLAGAYTYLGCSSQCGGNNNVSASPNSGVGGNPVRIDVNVTRFSIESGALVLFGNRVATVTDGYANIPGTINVLVPPGGSGTVDVDIINPSGICCGDNGGFTYNTSCTLTSAFPTTGPVSGGTNVTLDGSGFEQSPTPQVWFGSEQCTVVIWIDAGTLAVQSPPANGQTNVDITVVESGGSCTLPNGFNYLACRIDSITPNTGGTNGGQAITILGAGFDPFSLKVTFGAYYADLGSLTWTPTQINCTVPPSPIGGAVNVEIINETAQTRCTAVGGYTYVLPGGGNCSISSITPNQGGLGGGTTVTITGSGFDPLTGVLFGFGPATNVTVDPSGNSLTCVTPPYIGGLSQPPIPVDVVVAPENSNPCTSVNGYTYIQVTCPGGCSISSISPNNGPAAGGTPVTINGTGFCANGVSVTLGGQLMTNVVVIDEFTITANTPAGTAGSADAGYADGGGCVTFAPGMYTYN